MIQKSELDKENYVDEEEFEDEDEEFIDDEDEEFEDDDEEEPVEDEDFEDEEDEEDIVEESIGEDVDKDLTSTNNSKTDATVINQNLEVQDEPVEQMKSVTESNKEFMDIDRDAFTISEATDIVIKEIAFTEPSKKSRAKTVIGLTKTVQELGVLHPIDIMLLDEMSEEDRAILEEDGEVVPKYLLIDGLRRIFAATKNGLKTIPARVWNFKDKDLGQKISFDLGLWLNRTQTHKWSETWDLYQILEQQNGIKPAMFEFLFQLDAGDAMKLKDIMLSESEYDEIKSLLLNEEKTLEQCYKQLTKERKENNEDELSRADATGFGDTSEEASEITGDTDDSGVLQRQLDDSEAKELLEMFDDTATDGTVDGDDFDALNATTTENESHQDPGKRTFIDPTLKKAILDRDGFKCVCCGTGGPAFVDSMVIHHVVPVHTGLSLDSIEYLDKKAPERKLDEDGHEILDINGLPTLRLAWMVTLCDLCHNTLHVAERNNGRLTVTKEQFDKYTPSIQAQLIRILKLARVAFQSDKKAGVTRDTLIEATKPTHHMPTVNLKENTKLYNEYANDKKLTDLSNETDAKELEQLKKDNPNATPETLKKMQANAHKHTTTDAKDLPKPSQNETGAKAGYKDGKSQRTIDSAEVDSDVASVMFSDMGR